MDNENQSPENNLNEQNTAPLEPDNTSISVQEQPNSVSEPSIETPEPAVSEPSPEPITSNPAPAQNPSSDSTQTPNSDNVKKCNKHVFVWVFCFILGGLGVDRFVRGQIGIGVCKLLFGWLTAGIWPLVDWIIALVKVYGSDYSNTEEVTFVDGKYSH